MEPVECITPFGKYAFDRLPFGITSALEIFQQKMTQLLEGHSGVMSHIEDTLVFGRTPKEHDENLDRVLETLNKSGLKLNRENVDFGRTKSNFWLR